MGHSYTDLSSDEDDVTTLRGRLLRPRADEPRFDWMDDALLRIDAGGRVASVEPAQEGCETPETWPGAVMLPGFVDAHVHFPQTRIIGSASGPLLDWLDGVVFPEEARFAEATYGRAVAGEFCDHLLRWGTTCAGVFSSSHPGATHLLFEALERRGLRGMAGLTLMDRGAPEAVLLEAEAALEASEALAERWHGCDEGRLRFCLTPRFGLSCSPELLRGAGELARRRGLWVQTHLSENHAEIDDTAHAFPGSRDYLGVYEDHGLVHQRSIFAHCIHLSDDEWDRLARAGASVAHCPDSNFFLGSGSMRVRAATQRGVRVGLGSDVGAGRTFSMRRVAARAYDASLVAGAAIDAAEALWMATAGGAAALGLAGVVGTLAVGEDADLTVLNIPDGLSPSAVVDALGFRLDASPARATMVRGRILWESP